MMEPELVADIVRAAGSVWTVSNSLEVTLEANPTSVEAGKFEAYADAGVNRVSVGVQSLRDDDLKALGRLHSAEEAKNAIKIALQSFDRVSIDLIYARQNQTLDDWSGELREALDLGLAHMSLYQLTIEDGTAFGARHKMGKLRGLPDEDRSADLFEMTQDIMDAAGLRAYETSNHSRVGEESRHNLIYWTSGDWVGIGPGAHGRISLNGSRVATETHRQPADWLCAVRDKGSGESRRYSLNPLECLEEFVIMGLRLSQGVMLAKIPDGYLNKISILQSDGLLETVGANVRVTARGRQLLNRVIQEVLT